MGYGVYLRPAFAPPHENLLAELLSGHTKLTVVQATDGMLVEPDHLYILSPANYLSLRGAALHVEATPGKLGARLPFDVLLQSMAVACGRWAACVMLSGNGADGREGLLAIAKMGGFVIAQEPAEADYDGMPRSAIATGGVDRVLRLTDMPAALTHWHAQISPPGQVSTGNDATDRLPEIIELLRSRTAHDFSAYKPGTLKRRVERRMAMAAIRADDLERYIANLKTDPAELDCLAGELLIHVTGFFRDPAVFAILANTFVPDLIAARQPDQPLRIWVAGCSTGEEAYSLAIIFQEALDAANDPGKLQIFASDVDAPSVAFAREGFYPLAVATEVGLARLRRFFAQEDHGYRVLPELRSAIVFTVQDLLTDPPFPRIDLVSCRNVMIYLEAEAQRKMVALFHFALRNGGLLLLGHSEAVSSAVDRFEILSKPARLYRQIGRRHAADVAFSNNLGQPTRSAASEARSVPPSRQAALAHLCQFHALENHVPATVLSNRNHECLFLQGPTERYLRMAPGHPTLDILAMVSPDLRPRLRSAILSCVQNNVPVTVTGGTAIAEGTEFWFDVDIYPVTNDGEDLLLIYFVDQPTRRG